MPIHRDSSGERLILVVLDLLSFFLAANLAFDLRYHFLDWHELGLPVKAGPAPWGALYQALPYLLLGWFVMFSIFGVYRQGPDWRERQMQVFKAQVAFFLLMFATTFFYRGFSYSRGAALFLVPLSMGFTFGLRGLFAFTRGRLMRSEILRERVLLVGWSRESVDLVRRLESPERPFRLAGVLLREGQPPPDGVRQLGLIDDLGRVLTREPVERVLFQESELSRREMTLLLETCARHRVEWSVVPYLASAFSDRLRLDSLGGLPVLSPRGSNIVGLNWLIKRLFDLAAAATLAVALSPILLSCALLVRLSSPGPVLFVQKRVGRRGREFPFYKFRTMVAGARDRQHQQVMEQVIRDGQAPAQEGEAPLFKMIDDPRITRLGRFLRRYSLDELPQLVNVLKGDMSLVGPRPALPYEVAMYSERARRRLEVFPGITGLWQVSGRNRLPFDAMIDLDIQYLENWSLGLDIRILARTLIAVFTQRGY
ncbi:MAG: sugar transferase [Myxococcales bacterium]|nr:sugar transferase [Myxococcales bacterium]